jgi:hypothetical protein
MTAPTRFRTLEPMDEKLTTMAKSTVFAGCSRRELVVLGRLFEVARLRAGASVPTGPRSTWLHVVLEGSALSVVDGDPNAMVGEGATWPCRALAGSQGPGCDGHLVALTEVTMASLDARSLGALKRCSPAVATLFTRAETSVLVPEHEAVTAPAVDIDELVGVRSDG